MASIICIRQIETCPLLHVTWRNCFCKTPGTLLRLQGCRSTSDCFHKPSWQFPKEASTGCNWGAKDSAFLSFTSTCSPDNGKEGRAGIYNGKDYHLKPKTVVKGLGGRGRRIHCIFLRNEFSSNFSQDLNGNFKNDSWGHWINPSPFFWWRPGIVIKVCIRHLSLKYCWVGGIYICKIGSVFSLWNEKVKNIACI